MSKKSISILNFDAVAESEIGVPVAIKNPDGTETGLTLHVIGDNSDAVQKFSARVLREMRAREAQAKKAGKEVELDLDRIKEQNVEGAALRVIGWEGVDEAFDADLLKKALRRNPHWVNQILEVAGDQANFMKKA